MARIRLDHRESTSYNLIVFRREIPRPPRSQPSPQNVILRHTDDQTLPVGVGWGLLGLSKIRKAPVKQRPRLETKTPSCERLAWPRVPTSFHSTLASPKKSGTLETLLPTQDLCELFASSCKGGVSPETNRLVMGIERKC